MYALVPFLIAGIIALLLNPFVERLCQRGYSRPRAVFNVFLGFVLLMVGIGVALVPSFYQQAQNILDFFSSPKNANITRTVNKWVESVQDYLEREIKRREPWIQRNRDALRRLGIPTTPEEVDKTSERWRTRLQQLLTDWATKVFNAIVQTLLGILSRVIWVILIPLSVYFFLLDMPRVRQAFLYLLPPAQREPASRLLDEIGTVFFNYIRGLVTAALTYGLTCMVFFWVLGAPNQVEEIEGGSDKEGAEQNRCHHEEQTPEHLRLPRVRPPRLVRGDRSVRAHCAPSRRLFRRVAAPFRAPSRRGHVRAGSVRPAAPRPIWGQTASRAARR
jgi:predicted PurR-regulated permease PerM